MSENNQKQAFLSYEADNWFLRNRDHKYVAEEDIVVKVLTEYDAKPKTVLEIGCSFGYRLNAISTRFKTAKATGVEPSAEAINEGRKRYPAIDFIHGTADELSSLSTGSFDLVIIGFVLYVVDRDLLFKVVAESDRVLTDGGILMIIDFFSEKPVRNPYAHINSLEAYAFKQNYEDIFIASKLYHLLDKRSMNHSGKAYDLTGDYYNKYALATLRKDLAAGYK